MTTLPNNTHTEELSRTDRWGALVVLLIALALFALIVLATIFGEPSTEPIDHWPMMP